MTEELSVGSATSPDSLMFSPTISLNGPIDDKAVERFLEQLASVRSANQNLVLELNTLGGDADAARRIALEVRLFAAHSGCSAFCVGKSYVYSAGVTILAAFNKANRFLTEDTVVLIHERRLTKTLELSGPVSACLQIVKERVSMLESAQALEKQGFEEFVANSRLSVGELFECAKANCYLTANDLLDYGLIAKILR